MIHNEIIETSFACLHHLKIRHVFPSAAGPTSVSCRGPEPAGPTECSVFSQPGRQHCFKRESSGVVGGSLHCSRGGDKR